MKVAIMGAGLAGLSSAIILEKHGITPDIFEKRNRVGDRFVNCEIMLSILSRPVKDQISYLSEHFQIYLKPAANINKLIIYSENRKAEITGKLGFTNLRGRDQESYENQLANQVKSRIYFKSNKTYEDLLHEYTHVIMATGDSAYTDKIQSFNQALTVTLRGSTIAGNFDRYTVRGWLNNKLAPQGYGYLIPISEKEANIVIGFPDNHDYQTIDLEALWENFYQQVCFDLKQGFKITDNFSVRNYIIGICQSARIGNTFFTGNCFGSIMPFLGFGQFSAILSGIFAALDICDEVNYAEMITQLRESYQSSLLLRKTMEKMSNSDYDRVVKQLNSRLGEKIFDSRYNFLKLLSYLLRPYLKIHNLVSN